MRLEVICENRLGIAGEVLDLLVSFDLNLRSIDADQTGRIYVNFTELAFADFQSLMLSIRKIDAVKDVRSVPHLPSEQEHYGILTLLKTIPDPIFSIDVKANITRANEAGSELLQRSPAQLLNTPLQQSISGFSFQKWISANEVNPHACKITIQSIEYLAEMMPIYLPDEDQQGQILAGAVVMLKSSARIGKQYKALKSGKKNSFDNILAESISMRNLIDEAKKYATLEAPVLIQGATGTGKEVLARACHGASSHFDKPFVVVNCASIPDEVAESELFGYAANSLGSRKEGKQGLVTQAHGGTLFFDEISEMTMLQQMKLLRLIESGYYRHVGGDQEIKADVRIICSSQQDLAQLCQEGKFREDLYYRINVLTLNLQPLKNRPKDILPLAEMFLEHYAHKLSNSVVRLSSACRAQLSEYSWPGNVRQLKNSIYRGVSMAEDAVELGVDQLNLPSYSNVYGYYDDSFEGTLDQATKQFEANILRRLYPAHPSTRLLAKKLGVSHTAIANKLREYGISKKTAATSKENS